MMLCYRDHHPATTRKHCGSKREQTAASFRAIARMVRAGQRARSGGNVKGIRKLTQLSQNLCQFNRCFQALTPRGRTRAPAVFREGQQSGLMVFVAQIWSDLLDQAAQRVEGFLHHQLIRHLRDQHCDPFPGRSSLTSTPESAPDSRPDTGHSPLHNCSK